VDCVVIGTSARRGVGVGRRRERLVGLGEVLGQRGQPLPVTLALIATTAGGVIAAPSAQASDRGRLRMAVSPEW
jgi:hypothetical protein